MIRAIVKAPGNLPTLTEDEKSGLYVDTNGRLHTTGTGGGGGGGDASAANQLTEIAKLTSIDDNLPTIGQQNSAGSLSIVLASDHGPVTISGAVTATCSGTVSVSNFPSVQAVSDNGGSLTIDGTIAVSNFPAVQPVTDNGGSLTVDGTIAVSNFPAVQPVSDDGGSLTVDGTVAATQSGAWTVTVSGTPSVSISSSALPTGAATESTLSTLNGKFGLIGQKTMAGSAPVVIASDQSTLPISAASLPLPSGAATSANQTSANASLTNIDGKIPALVSGRTPVDGSGVTQPISAASLPLPTGAATDANQTTANASLTSIDDKTPSLNSSTATGAITAAVSGVIKASAGRLRWVRVGYRGTGTAYFQLHDTNSTGTIAAGTIKGFGVEMTGGNRDFTIDCGSGPKVFTSGIAWAVSTTQDTYTASAQTCVVEAAWE